MFRAGGIRAAGGESARRAGNRAACGPLPEQGDREQVMAAEYERDDGAAQRFGRHRP
jgi:hypothetical protein